MTVKVSDILKANELVWRGKAGATTKVLKALSSDVDALLPASYLDFLRLCNGGSGWTKNQENYFIMYTAEDVLQVNCDSDYPDYFVFGSDGSAGRLAFKINAGDLEAVHLFDSFEPKLIHRIVTADFTDFISMIVLPESEVKAES